MTGRGARVARRWAAMAAGAVVCGWLSTLTPATSTMAARTAERHAANTVAAGKPGPGAEVKPTSTPEPEPTPKPPPDCRKVKCVALTFDDGPMGSTARLLDMLAAHQVKATFFLVGRNVEQYPELVRREAAEGHELANHSYSHADLGRSSTAKVTSELERTQRAIRRAAGVTPVLMRPPYGSTDKQVAAVTRRLELAQVLWTLDPLDWRFRDSGRVERKVVGGTRQGHIVLMHDIHSTTVDAVPLIIKRLAEKGYVFVTVSELYGKPLTPGKKYIEREPEPLQKQENPGPQQNQEKPEKPDKPDKPEEPEEPEE
ncbi:polysaccharide deacetylase family protein [Actinomadura sp. 9N407]|uniref:polysaccharide deacetylase family protein n=1 Tax=Actinomadura sp. 9N407 TaxID=3375154 RepID=UPI0037AED194